MKSHIKMKIGTVEISGLCSSYYDCTAFIGAFSIVCLYFPSFPAWAALFSRWLCSPTWHNLSHCLVLYPHFLSLSVKNAASARSSVHSQGVLHTGSFLKAFLMDWPDIPSKWSTLSVNSLSDKDPPLFTFPFYKSSPRYEVHKEGQMSTKSSLYVWAGGKMG